MGTKTDNLGAIAAQPWFQKKIEEGLASPIVGPLTRERVEQFVSEGIARSKRRALLRS